MTTERLQKGHMIQDKSKIVQSRLFKLLTIAVCGYGLLLTIAGFVVGRVTPDGIADFRQRWFEVQHFVHRINPSDVMSGKVAALEGVPFVYIGGYPPWSYTVGSILIPPLPFQFSLAVFTLFQLLSLLGILLLIYQTTQRYLKSIWAGFFFMGIFLSQPGLATDLKWGNYTTIAVFALMACILLCRSRRRFVALLGGLCFSIAFVKPQLAALFGLVLLWEGYWRSWTTAAGLVLMYTMVAAITLQSSPWTLIAAVFESTVSYRELYSYAQYYNYGLFDILKLFEVPVGLIVKCELVLGIAAVTALCLRYRRYVPAVTLWAIPATFAPLWAYNQKYDWLIIFFLLFAFGLYALQSRPVVMKRNLLCFALLTVLSIVLTFKLVWFGYVANCCLQFALRLIWLVALGFLLHWQREEHSEVSRSQALV